MTIDQPVELNVVIVFAEGSDEDFRYLKPSDEKTKLQQENKTHRIVL